MGKTLFINCSPNHSGITVSDAKQYMRDVEYDTIHLGDYHIDQYGLVTEQDQISEVFSLIDQYDSLVIGTPVYWYTISGILKTFMDRWYMLPEAECLADKISTSLFKVPPPTNTAKQRSPTLLPAHAH